MGTISVPDADRIESFDDLLLFFDAEVGIFRNRIGSYAVISREGNCAKGMLCISLKQASDIYKFCVKRLCDKYSVMN